VGVDVGVGVSVEVAVEVGVDVGVGDGVEVFVGVDVGVAVGTSVGVAVGTATATSAGLDGGMACSTWESPFRQAASNSVKSNIRLHSRMSFIFKTSSRGQNYRQDNTRSFTPLYCNPIPANVSAGINGL